MNIIDIAAAAIITNAAVRLVVILLAVAAVVYLSINFIRSRRRADKRQQQGERETAALLETIPANRRDEALAEVVGWRAGSSAFNEATIQKFLRNHYLTKHNTTV